MKLSPKALGLTFGILWGVTLGAMTLLALYTGYLSHLAEMLIGVYPYYEVSLMGAVAGLVWGFVDGFVCGLITAWVYNLFAPSSAK